MCEEAGISLGAILQTPHVSAETKAAAISAILMKEVVVLSNTNGTIRGMTLEINTYQQFLKGVRSATEGGDIKPRHLEQPQTNSPEVVRSLTSKAFREIGVEA
jgi:hypothetical protein